MKIIKLLGFIFILLFIASIVITVFLIKNPHGVTEEKASKIMEKHIEEKYNIDIKVIDIRSKYGLEMFRDGYFDVKAKYQGEEFNIYMDKISQNITDTYGAVLFNDKINLYIDEIMSNSKIVKDYKYRIGHSHSSRKWENTDSISDYFRYTDTHVGIDIEVEGEDIKDIAKEIIILTNKLKDSNIYYYMDIKYNDILIRDTYTSLIDSYTENEIINKLSNTE